MPPRRRGACARRGFFQDRFHVGGFFQDRFHVEGVFQDRFHVEGVFQDRFHVERMFLTAAGGYYSCEDLLLSNCNKQKHQRRIIALLFSNCNK
jgi:hypothetical protein